MKTLKQILNEKKHQEVISIAPNRPVFDALVILAEYKIGALAVIDEGQLVGIFSERDYAREVVLKGRSSRTTLINEVMTAKVISASPQDLVDSAMQTMSDRRIRHLPIVENGTILGMLSVGDLLKETIAYQQGLIEQLENYIQGN
ncbi:MULTISPECIES: CBS domain-containing protein [unclassified Methylotenera]|jgi:CBS domain-containing protein|uniref:CBS domain-containing protein n=1 Tax=unclassified Methylotenera TaxID=2643294 RepID=UPI00036A6C03|nr:MULTISPECIES: CBS domain-containing protein [unclassified Methylotenera]